MPLVADTSGAKRLDSEMAGAGGAFAPYLGTVVMAVQGVSPKRMRAEEHI